eukprot:7889377-Lingulodinium_polyedra.AAC.1
MAPTLAVEVRYARRACGLALGLKPFTGCSYSRFPVYASLGVAVGGHVSRVTPPHGLQYAYVQ